MSNNFKRRAKQVEKLKDELEDRAERSLKASMKLTTEQLQWKLAQNQSVATGHLYENIDPRPMPSDEGKVIVKRGIYAPDYWRFLEYGTGIYTGRSYSGASPRAPVNAIYMWIREKGIVPKPGGSADTQLELAFAIAESLETGAHSHPFVRPTWRGPAGREAVIRNLKRDMGRALNRAF